MISRPVVALLLALAAAGCDEPTAPPVSAEDARAALAVDGLKLTGRVVDQDQIIDQSITKSIEARSAALEARTGHQLVVVTIASLNGANIVPASLLLFRRWGIVRKGLDDGVGILIAPNEHKVRIEVGKGPEAQLSDPTCARIIADEGIPRFKKGDVSGGALAMTNAVAAALEHPAAASAT